MLLIQNHLSPVDYFFRPIGTFQMSTQSLAPTPEFSDSETSRPLSEDEQAARQLTMRIRISLESAYTLIVEAFLSEAWRVLGYTSWDAYCKEEFGNVPLQPPLEQRQQVILSMREAGMSCRAIGAATDIHYTNVGRTIRRAELSGVANATPDSGTPAKPIRGLDGRNYSATPRPRVEVPADDDAMWDQSASAIGIEQVSIPAPKAKQVVEQHRDVDGAMQTAINSIASLTSDTSRFESNSPQITRELGGTVGRSILSVSHLVSKLDPQTLALDDRGLTVFRQNLQDSVDMLVKYLDDLPLISLAAK